MALPLEGRRAQRLDPRRRGRDRRPAADRVPAAAAEGRRLRGRHPVLDGRRRGARPAQDGLPRPAQPRRDRRGGRASIAQSRGRRPRRSSRLPLDDKQTYEMLARGDATRRVPVRVVGHARRAARRQADRVRRPDRARGALPARADAEHPGVRAAQERPRAGRRTRTRACEPILERTQGIYIYQEQSMQIAKDLAGFSPAEADDLRKAIGKKVASADGVAEGEVPRRAAPATASPSAVGRSAVGRERALAPTTRSTRRTPPATRSSPIAPPTCKANYPGRVHGGPDLVGHAHQGPGAVLRHRVRRHGHRGAAAGRQLELGSDFTVVDGRIRFGLIAVKGVGEGAVRAIVTARDEGGPFTSIWDFCERVDAQVVNKRVLESLIKCGGARLHRRVPPRHARGARAARSQPGRRRRPTRMRRAGVDLRPRAATVETAPARSRRSHPPVTADEFDRARSCSRSRRRRSACTSRATRSRDVRDQLRAQGRPAAAGARRAGRRQGGHGRRRSSRACAS